jgi:hypothetical protein
MRDGHCDWLENARSANGAKKNVRAPLPPRSLPQAIQADGVRGCSGTSSAIRSPSLTAERTPLSTQGADVSRSRATVTLVQISSLFHVAWSFSSHQKLSRACAGHLNCDGGLGENATPKKISHLVGVQSNHSR